MYLWVSVSTWSWVPSGWFERCLRHAPSIEIIKHLRFNILTWTYADRSPKISLHKVNIYILMENILKLKNSFKMILLLCLASDTETCNMQYAIMDEGENKFPKVPKLFYILNCWNNTKNKSRKLENSQKIKTINLYLHCVMNSCLKCTMWKIVHKCVSRAHEGHCISCPNFSFYCYCLSVEEKTYNHSVFQ